MHMHMFTHMFMFMCMCMYGPVPYHTYQRRRAACPGGHNCTCAVHVPASGVPYCEVPRA